MVQVRKLVLAMAAASALSSGIANALELGELTLRSAVNQPLLAEIELLDVRGLTAAEVQPVLAPAEEFSKAGVERQAFLDSLRFTPVINASGRSVIRVTSTQPLSAPLVKFLVQVNFPSGRLLRDYSMLLDPAQFAPQAAQAAQNAPQPALSAPAASANQASYTTGSRDTLWEIAARNRQGSSVQQAMLAIQALNPDAFLDGNINRLKTGQVLRMPDAQQTAATAPGPAVAEVARQNAAWREGRRLGPRAQQVDATRRGNGAPAPAAAPPQDNLSLVSGASEANGPAGDARALDQKLAVTQEALDSTRRDNEELRSRNADLQSQLDKLQKLIQLKNDQLAKMQAAGADVPVPAEALAPAQALAPADASGEPAEGDPDAPVNAALVPAPAVPGATEQVNPDAAASTPALPQGEPLDATTDPADDAVAEQPSDNSTLLMVVGASALAALLLLLLLLARRRKAQQEAEKHMRMARALAEEPDHGPDLDLPPNSFEGLERPAATVHLTPAMVAASVAGARASAAPATFAEAPAPTVLPTPPLRPSIDTDEGLFAEVEQSIARGRLNHAAELLEAATEREPKRSDLRLKLMEVYGLQGDRDGFVGQERQLIATGQNHADVERLKARFPAMLGVAAAAAGAAAAAAQMDAEYVKQLLHDEPGSADSLDGTFDTDFDLNLDDTPDPAPTAGADIDFDTLLAEQKAAAGNSTDEPETTLPEDFDLSLADDAEEPQAPESRLNEINAELEKLSDGFARTPMAEPFAVPPKPEDLPPIEGEDDFDYLDGGDEAGTKLDLARAYIEMGDNDGARDILGEVIKEGSTGQQDEAREMLGRISR
ncbi:FimV family protein [Pseudomonas sp. CFBP 13727]|uniref:FimV family protein n=1 Tax=Pseudomonas sp. CFBP 13727 TaxID=2775295 RepID=UPI00177F69A2|nr:FimV family protein [Pseudomonas sp. CFBP 13727]MBD8622922.1 FimV family protein [Pseudomonas sp. CFBP 13727]